MKKQNKPTVAQEIFKDKDILTSRPEGMEYEHYRILRVVTNRVIKKLFAGNCDSKITSQMGLRRGYNQH
jgi:hypothetical protein